MNRRILKDEQAVSPVIAVILMVAITVVLAAVLYVWASSFLAGTNKQAPIGAMAPSAAGDDWRVEIIKMTPSVSVNSVEWFLKDTSGNTAQSGFVSDVYGYYVGADSDGDGAGDMCIVFSDNDFDGKLTPGDKFDASSDCLGFSLNGYAFSLKFNPTGDQIYEVNF